MLETPLAAAHERAGARMIEFAGFRMPVRYAGQVEEHHAVRRSAGLFDVSHMGEVFLEGPGAEELLQRTTPNDVSKLVPGRAHYSSLLTELGTMVDDLLVYRLGEQRFMVVVNAACREKDVAWLRSALEQRAEELPGPVEIRDESERTALLALQGPRSLEVLESVFEGDSKPGELRFYSFQQEGRVAGRQPRVLSRTGYTGEDGFELYVEAEDAETVWDALLAHEAVSPAGLGARDTLRLEAGLCLYGNDIDDSTTPIEAGLGFTVKLKKGEFTGREVLERQRREGVSRRLVGLLPTGRGIARHGHEVRSEGRAVGRVTSGTHCPTLERAAAMAYVDAELADEGTELEIDVRGRTVPATVAKLPFYDRKKKTQGPA